MLPYLGMFLGSIFCGKIHDLFINRGFATKATMRKFFNTVATLGPASCLLWLAFVGCNRSMAVAALVLANTLGSGCNAGFFVSHVMVPNIISITQLCYSLS